jgi:syntaxin 5
VQKLERLAQLAKRTGAFDDPSREIAELSAVIKQDITALNTAIAELQTHAAMRRDDGASSKQSAAHAGTIVDTLKGRLMGATKSFKETLTERAESVKQQQARRAMFSGMGPGGDDDDGGGGGGGGGCKRERVVNPFARADADGGNFPRALADMNAALGIPSSSGGGGGGGNLQSSGAGGLPTYSAGSSSHGMYGDESQQMLLRASSRQTDSRTEALHNVERTITELGGIFQQLATMVAEQGEMAVRIDENVDDAVMNVDSAQTQLLKYLNRISSNRWLIMKIFGVLIFFLTFFVVFIA